MKKQLLRGFLVLAAASFLGACASDEEVVTTTTTETSRTVAPVHTTTETVHTQ